jgi:hypothetical protein
MNPKNIFTALVNKTSGSDFSTDIGGRFYAEMAPQEADYPHCIFSIVTNNPEYTFSEDYEETTIQFSLYSISAGVTEITDMFKDLTALFDECSLTITDQTLIWMVRQTTTTMYEDITTDVGTVGLRHWAVDYNLIVEV